MHFGNLNNYRYFLLIIIFILIVWFGYKKRFKILDILNLKNNKKKDITKIIFMLCGLIFICFSLLDPQVEKGYKKIMEKGLDIYILIDVSKSMETKDIKPSRMIRVKSDIGKLLDNLKGDRIGFIPFSETSYIQMPLTNDYDMAKIFLSVVDTNMILGGGTNIGNAINLANKSFEKSATGEKVIIIFTDGEDHHQNTLNELKKLKNTRMYVVGVGTIKGGLIPAYNKEGNIIDYKKDKSGKYVTSRLNEKTLGYVTKLGRGKYFTIESNDEAIKGISRDLNTLKKIEREGKKIKIYTKLYYIFLLIGIILFLIGYFI